MAAKWMKKCLSSRTEQEKYRKYPKVSLVEKLVETNEKKEVGLGRQKTFPLLPVTLAQPPVLTPSLRISYIPPLS